MFYYTTRTICNHPECPHLVVGEVVESAPPFHGNGHAAVGVEETHEQVASAIIHRKQPSHPLPEIFLGDNPVHFFCNSPAKGIVDIFDRTPAREIYSQQLAAG